MLKEPKRIIAEEPRAPDYSLNKGMLKNSKNLIRICKVGLTFSKKIEF